MCKGMCWKTYSVLLFDEAEKIQDVPDEHSYNHTNEQSIFEIIYRINL